MGLPEAACAHCGEPVADGERFCCSGCATVYAVLHEAGLEAYYRTRERMPEPAPLREDTRPDVPEDPALARRYVDGERCVTLGLDGIHCGSCGWVIEHLLAADEAVESVSVSLGREQARVTLRSDAAEAPPLRRLADRLGKAGYRATPRLDGEEPLAPKGDRTEILRLGVAAACAMNTMLFAVSLYGGEAWGIDPALEQLFRWLSFLISLPLVGFSAWPILQRAVASLRQGLIHVDVPVAVAIAVMWVSSTVATVRGEGDVWFDSLAMLVVLLLGGRQLERSARRRASRRMETLVGTADVGARRVGAEGEETVPAEALEVGDRIRLLAGDVLGVDALVLEGRSEVDLAVVDGESRPVPRGIGDELPAGARVLDGALLAHVLRPASHSNIARTRQQVEQALASRTKLESTADRVARWFVVAVLLVAAGVAAAWWQIDPSRVVPVTVAVLVVACPCALALATPLGFAAAVHGAARRGILLRSGSALLRLAGLRTVAFDKTGTLTESRLAPGSLELTAAGEELGAREVLQLGAALAARSSHPVSRAVSRAWEERFGGPLSVADEVTERPGEGLHGRRSGHEIELVRPEATIRRDGVTLGTLHLDAPLRRGAGDAMGRLRALGVTPVVLSGDAPERVKAVTGPLGIEGLGALRPEDKAAWIEAHRDSAGPIGFVGDGINDSAALASAEAGLGMGGAVGLAVEAADGVVVSRRPGAVADAILLGRRLRSTLRSNLVLSALYNALAVAGAATGVVGPLLAAALMPLSSLVVVLRAARLAEGD